MQEERKQKKLQNRYFYNVAVRQNVLFGSALIIVIVMIACLIFGIRSCVVASGSMEQKVMTRSFCMIRNTLDKELHDGS